MKYISTKNSEVFYSLRDAAFMGLAPDGGLFVPAGVPIVKPEEIAGASFPEMAARLAGIFFGDEVQQTMLDDICREAFDFPVPLKHLGDNRYTLELFHGPTMAFKDFGARFMARMMARLHDGDRELTVLTATSGDTGGAVANGFYGVPGVNVVILYPEDGVSTFQERQMTSFGDNIHPVKVQGTFDDCQRMTRKMLGDAECRRRHNLTSANSINVLRWLPQSFYYFHGCRLWREATGRERPTIVVPSGNYGNLAAGILGRRMSNYAWELVAASNANSIVPDFLRTGVYRPEPSRRTLSNAMDVGQPSNFERMLWLFGGYHGTLKDAIRGAVCSDASTLQAIRELYDTHGYVSDPHSAVGYHAFRQLGADGFWLSTASACKFADVVEKALGAGVIPGGEFPPPLQPAHRITPGNGDLRELISQL